MKDFDEPRVTFVDAEYQEVEPPLRVPWFFLVWWGACVAGAAMAVYEIDGTGEASVIVVGASAIWPMLRAFLWASSALTSTVSEQEALRVRERLLGRGATPASGLPLVKRPYRHPRP